MRRILVGEVHKLVETIHRSGEFGLREVRSHGISVRHDAFSGREGSGDRWWQGLPTGAGEQDPWPTKTPGEQGNAWRGAG